MNPSVTKFRMKLQHKMFDFVDAWINTNYEVDYVLKNLTATQLDGEEIDEKQSLVVLDNGCLIVTHNNINMFT